MHNANFKNFEEAGQAILKFLSQRFGFKLWMITRTEGNDWIVLLSEDNGYDIKPGQVFNWADSFCSQMVLNNAPRIVPYSPDIQIYANAPINQLVTIQAYIGQPLLKKMAHCLVPSVRLILNLNLKFLLKILHYSTSQPKCLVIRFRLN